LQNQAAGCITAPANLISRGLREIYDLFMAGGDPADTQAKVSEQRHILDRYQPYAASLKALLARLFGQPRWPVRPPLVEVSKTDEDKAVLEFVT
jgi:dihydrodipicolinate synthase/N-acetylneuraminate lyase